MKIFTKLRIWKKVSCSNPIMFLDSTGTISRKVKGQKSPFLYSMVVHDQENKCIIPIIEWVSTATNHVNISKYLTTCKDIFDDNSISYPRLIVTDHSWALINAVLLSFNQCNLQNYLNWSYIIFVQKIDDLALKRKMKVRIYLCSTHFLKCIIKNSKLIKIEKEIRRAFIYFFTLIQNSTALNQIEIYLINIHNIFMSKDFDMSVQYSLQTLASELKNRKLNNVDIDNERSLPHERERDKNHEKFIEESNIYFVVDFDKKVKENSPWNNYFNILIEQWNEHLENRSILNKKTLNLRANPFYSPSLFNLIHRELHKLPLWTGLFLADLNFSYIIKTRLTNNPAENHFLQVKHRILNRRKWLYCSEIVAAFFNILLAKFHKHYDDEKTLIGSSKTHSTVHQDVWKPEKRNRVKGVYFDSCDLLHLKESNSAPFNVMKFNELFDQFNLKNYENSLDKPIILTEITENIKDFQHENDDLSENIHQNFNQNFQNSSGSSSSAEDSEIHLSEIDEVKDASQVDEEILEWFSRLPISIEATQPSDTVYEFKNLGFDNQSLNMPPSDTKLTGSVEILGNLKESFCEQSNETENILDDEEILKMLKFEFCSFIEKKNKNYDAIKKQFLSNSDLFDKIILEIRAIEPSTIYSNQHIDKKYADYKRSLQLDDHLYAVFSTGDGACLYHSIALIIFGTETFSFLIKLCSIYMLLKNEEYFRKGCESWDITFEKFVLDSCKWGEYGKDLNVISIEIFLNRNILCYNQSKNPLTPVLYNFSQRTNKNPILLGLVTEHFFPVLSKFDSFKPFKKHTDVDLCSFKGIEKFAL
jgi:hypothetical protein